MFTALRLQAILLNLLLPKKSRSFLDPDMGTWWRCSFIHMHTRDSFQEKPHLQRNISHIDRPHPSQSKLLPLGLQIIRSQFIDHGISRLFPLAGEKHRIQWTFTKKQSSTKTKNLFRNTIEKILDNKLKLFSRKSWKLGSYQVWKLGMTGLEK